MTATDTAGTATGTADATGRRRLEPDARRRQILACAVRLFGDRPYAEVSTTDIAREAGVARGLINHYFGTKKDLYLEVVRRLVTIPDDAFDRIPAGSRAERVDASVGWFLDVVARLGRAWFAAVNAEGIGRDPDVVRILEEADDVTANHMVTVLGLEPTEYSRALMRTHAGTAKVAAAEWMVRGALTREQVHALLTRTLLAIVDERWDEQ